MSQVELALCAQVRDVALPAAASRDAFEPAGTSACSNGRFYCRNRGHQPLVLNSSFVDDGICGETLHLPLFCVYLGFTHVLTSSWLWIDCCDGSDEVQGCKNTCKAAGSAARQELVGQTKDYAAGAKSRLKYVSQSQANQAQWKSDLEKVKKDITQQQSVTDKAKGGNPTL